MKKRYFRKHFIKFLQQLNDYSENDLALKLVDDFLASCYASLTIKSSHFVWSITSQNLNQFLKKLVFWNQHENFCLLIKFEKIWDGGLTGWDGWHRMTHQPFEISTKPMLSIRVKTTKYPDTGRYLIAIYVKNDESVPCLTFGQACTDKPERAFSAMGLLSNSEAEWMIRLCFDFHASILYKSEKTVLSLFNNSLIKYGLINSSDFKMMMGFYGANHIYFKTWKNSGYQSFFSATRKGSGYRFGCGYRNLKTYSYATCDITVTHDGSAVDLVETK